MNAILFSLFLPKKSSLFSLSCTFFKHQVDTVGEPFWAQVRYRLLEGVEKPSTPLTITIKNNPQVCKNFAHSINIHSKSPMNLGKKGHFWQLPFNQHPIKISYEFRGTYLCRYFINFISETTSRPLDDTYSSISRKVMHLRHFFFPFSAQSNVEFKK